MTRLRADLLLISAAMVWGLAFVFQKRAMNHMGPFTFITVRSLLAVLALCPMAWLEYRRAAKRGQLSGLFRIAVGSGVLFFGGAAFQQSGLQTATVTNTGFLTALYVIFTPFVAWIWHRLVPNRVVWPAAVASFAGTWLLGGGSLAAFGVGDLWVALSAVFWAVHVVATGASSEHDRPVLFTAIQFGVVGVLGLVAAVSVEAPSSAGILAGAWDIAYVGLLSSALTFTILAVAMKHTPASEAAVIVSTESLFGALAGAVLLGERLSWVAWTGASLILAAVLMVQCWPAWSRARNRGAT